MHPPPFAARRTRFLVLVDTTTSPIHWSRASACCCVVSGCWSGTRPSPYSWSRSGVRAQDLGPEVTCKDEPSDRRGRHRLVIDRKKDGCVSSPSPPCPVQGTQRNTNTNGTRALQGGGRSAPTECVPFEGPHTTVPTGPIVHQGRFATPSWCTRVFCCKDASAEATLLASDTMGWCPAVRQCASKSALVAKAGTHVAHRTESMTTTSAPASVEAEESCLGRRVAAGGGAAAATASSEGAEQRSRILFRRWLRLLFPGRARRRTARRRWLRRTDSLWGFPSSFRIARGPLGSIWYEGRGWGLWIGAGRSVGGRETVHRHGGGDDEPCWVGVIDFCTRREEICLPTGKLD